MYAVNTDMATQHLPPAGGNIHHLQGVYVLTFGTQSTVVHQVHFEMSGLVFIPIHAPHGNQDSQPGRWRCHPLPMSNPLRSLLRSGQTPSQAGDADPFQLSQRVFADFQFPVCLQMPGHPYQVRLQTFCTGVIQATGDDADGILDFGTVGFASLTPAGFAGQFAFQ